jgi:hypothetical protein
MSDQPKYQETPSERKERLEEALSCLIPFAGLLIGALVGTVNATIRWYHRSEDDSGSFLDLFAWNFCGGGLLGVLIGLLCFVVILKFWLK